MFSIKSATTDDKFLINKLASQVWEPTYGSILSDEQLNYMFEMMYDPDNIYKQITEQGHQYFIIYIDNEPSGYMSIEKKEDDLFIFQKIYALPKAQGTGMGRYMIEQGIEYLKSIHPTPFTIQLYVNRDNTAVGFYKHLGFVVADTRDHHIGNNYYMNDYIMELLVR